MSATSIPNLDTLVKVAQILTPFVLVLVGWWVSISLNKQTHANKLSSDFNTKWSDEFITRCRDFNNSASKLQITIYNMANKSESVIKYKQEFNDIVYDLQRQSYDIEVHSSVIENSDEILKLVNMLFEMSAANVKKVKAGGHINFEDVKELQTKLNSELKVKQKSVLEL